VLFEGTGFGSGPGIPTNTGIPAWRSLIRHPKLLQTAPAEWESCRVATLYLHPGLGTDAAIGARVTVAGEEARHAITVARVRIGERIAVGDGDGLIAWGTVVESQPTSFTVVVDEVHWEEQPRPELWLAQALAKGDRDELAVQAATELGVAGVIPWAADRSISRWEGAKVAKGRDRWATIVREASKQAIRPRVPEVAELATTKQLAAFPGHLVVLEPDAPAALTELHLDDADRVILLVGPEGGVSPHELALLEAAGASLVHLGREVLRTSTAGPAALAVLAARLGRWS
jgi:16S rRNA (uracil1498-N3)-methyltransferase